MDANQPYFVSDSNANYGNSEVMTPFEMSRRFQEFIKNWVIEDHFFYRDQLLSNCAVENFWLRVNFSDIESFDVNIAIELKQKMLSNLSVLEDSIRELYLALEINKIPEEVPSIQLIFYSEENPKKLRHLSSDDIGKTIKVQGIVVNASRVLIKGKLLVVECSKCKHTKRIPVEYGMCHVKIPAVCEKKDGNKDCPMAPYRVVPEKSSYIDYQTLKIQESSDSMPVGEIPRCYTICAERSLCDQMTPGSKVSLTGVYTINEKKTVGRNGDLATIKVPYLYMLGFESDEQGSRSHQQNFTDIEQAKFHELAKDPDIYNKLSKSIAPGIWGHEDIKRAICCLLFGGSVKTLPDKTRLRGDINVLIIGDPSTAKSQFLKFVHQVAPISVFTSGKGSSAAGLTAAIIKDKSSGEFHLEGGALVLADGGVVCIDEFDKMRAQDRVAIHEAMEQQTISIAKAGITTMLNSRTSILAASNPVFGKFIESMNFQEQIDFKTTILSRFDCIFQVRDIKNAENDQKIAEHIVGLHIKNAHTNVDASLIDSHTLKRYIAYARQKCFPRLSDEAAQVIQDIYVNRRTELKDKTNAKKSPIPITVRQLEALIRLSESIAKTRLSTVVTKNDVEIANEIFDVSTVHSIKAGVTEALPTDPDVEKIEIQAKHLIPLHSVTTHELLHAELMRIFHNSTLVNGVIAGMINRGIFKQTGQDKIKRVA